MAEQPTWMDQLKAYANLLGSRMGKTRGWKTRVAGELGIDKSTLGKLLDNKRPGVSRATIEQIAADHPEFAKLIQLAAPPEQGATVPGNEPAGIILELAESDRLGPAVARALRAHLAALERPVTRADVERFIALYERGRKADPGTGPRRITDRPAKPR